MWFNNKRRRKLEMIQAIRPTSKATLKMQCIFATKGDIDEANKLYDYFAKDMPELPDYDPTPPTWVDSTKNVANGLMGWLKDNQSTIAQGYDFVRQIVANRGALPELSTGDTASPLPPINDDTA